MFSAENAKRELHGHGGEQSLKLDGRAIPSTGADDSCSRSPLALPAPDSTEGDSQQEGETRVLEVGGESVKIDKLGPLIVNTDGTLSRITNWQELTPSEQERMIRLVVKKRNKTRLATQQQRQQQSSASDDSSEPLALAGSGSAQSAEDPSGSAMSPVPAKGAPLGAGVSKEGDVADPRGGDESARRSVEEKVVGLMEEEAV